MKDDFPKRLAALKTADAVNAINGVAVLGMQNSCRRSGSGGGGLTGEQMKQDIRELCPSLRTSAIEGALRKSVASGELEREDIGKNTCYYRFK